MAPTIPAIINKISISCQCERELGYPISFFMIKTTVKDSIVAPLAIQREISIKLNALLIKSSREHVKLVKFATKEPKKTPGNVLYPKKITAAAAIPDAGHIAVALSGGRAIKKPNFAGMK